MVAEFKKYNEVATMRLPCDRQGKTGNHFFLRSANLSGNVESNFSMNCSDYTILYLYIKASRIHILYSASRDSLQGYIVYIQIFSLV